MKVQYGKKGLSQYFPICCEKFKKEIGKVGKFVSLSFNDKQEPMFNLVTRNGNSIDLGEEGCPFCKEMIEFVNLNKEEKVHE